MARPLPASFPQDLLPQAQHFRYAFYLDTPLTVGDKGQVEAADEKAKEAFFKRALEAWKTACEHGKPLLEAAANRMERQAAALAAQGLDARCVTYHTATRLLAGLGYQNGAEVGLSLHPLYGVPYLPGSSVKGVVRAWAEQQGAGADTLTRLFGSPSKHGEGDEAAHQQGAIRFFDALPAAWPRLVKDVMTPHFAPYYGDPAQEAPAVWHDPNPVAFLAVEAGTPFRFLLAALPGEGFARPGDLGDVVGWLGEALAWLGAGGKTAAGYGRFATDALDALFNP